MSRYKTQDYSNRREYLDGLPSTLADLPAAKHTQGAVFPTDRPKRAKLPSN